MRQSPCELPDRLHFLGLAQRILRNLAFETLVQFSQLRLRYAELSGSLQYLVLKTGRASR